MTQAPATTVVATTAVPATQPMTEEETEEEKVLAAYEESWQVWFDANDPPDGGHPGIDAHLTGASRDRLLEQINNNRALGLSFRLPTASKFRVELESIEVRDSTAVLVVCVVDDGLVVETATGNVVNDRLVARRAQATLLNEAGYWRTADEAYLGEWIGADRCGA